MGACLPSIGNDLHASAGDLSLISAVYVLSLVIFNIVAAQLIAIMGQRRVFLYGFAIFLVMCLSLAFSPNVELVWGQRFIQGAGAAMVATSSVTLLISIAPRSMQGRLMGLLTASTYVGIALGPLVGGGIATALGWRWLFVVLLPLGVLAWIAMFRTVRVRQVPVPTGPPRLCQSSRYSPRAERPRHLHPVHVPGRAGRRLGPHAQDWWRTSL